MVVVVRYGRVDIKSKIIHDEACLLTCIRYIELNPVRADMVKSPGAYPWTSYQANAQGKDNEIKIITLCTNH